MLLIKYLKYHDSPLNTFLKSPHSTLDTAIPALAELGYDGIEIPLKAVLQYGKDKFKAMTSQYNMKVIIMVMTDGPVAPGAGLVFGGPYPGFTSPNRPGETDKRKIVANHVQVFKEQVEAAQDLKPYFINSHSCKDYFTKAMALETLRQWWIGARSKVTRFITRLTGKELCIPLGCPETWCHVLMT